MVEDWPHLLHLLPYTTWYRSFYLLRSALLCSEYYLLFSYTPHSL